MLQRSAGSFDRERKAFRRRIRRGLDGQRARTRARDAVGAQDIRDTARKSRDLERDFGGKSVRRCNADGVSSAGPRGYGSRTRRKGNGKIGTRRRSDRRDGNRSAANRGAHRLAGGVNGDNRGRWNYLWRRVEPADGIDKTDRAVAANGSVHIPGDGLIAIARYGGAKLLFGIHLDRSAGGRDCYRNRVLKRLTGIRI